MMEIDTNYLKNLQTLLDFVYQSGAQTAAIAGGAIRDMLFNKPVKDIDVFYTGELKTKTLECIFDPVEECYTKYEDSSFTLTHNVNYSSIFPVPIQLIQVEDVVKTINQFPTAVGRVYYNGYGLNNMDEKIFVAHQNQTIWFDKITNITYYKKYAEKYAEYKLKFVTEGFKPKEFTTALPLTEANLINTIKDNYSKIFWSKMEAASHSL